MILRLILCAVIVAGGVWFLAWTIWNLRLPSWLAGRPERYVPRHRAARWAEEVLADDNGEPLADLFDGEDGAFYDDDDADFYEDDGPRYDPPERQAIQTAYIQGVYLPLTAAVPIDDTITDWNGARISRREARAALWRPPGPGWAHQAAAALADEYWPKAIEAGA